MLPSLADEYPLLVFPPLVMHPQLPSWIQNAIETEFSMSSPMVADLTFVREIAWGHSFLKILDTF